jgi:hypothetical protein
MMRTPLAVRVRIARRRLRRRLEPQALGKQVFALYRGGETGASRDQKARIDVPIRGGLGDSEREKSG